MDNFEKMSSKKIKRKAKELFEEMDGVELIQEKGVDSRGHAIYEVRLSKEGEVWTKDVKSPSSTGSSSNWLKRLKSKLRSMLRDGPDFRGHGSVRVLTSWDENIPSWFSVLKTDIDFEFNEGAGYYGQYNRLTDEIVINLSAFGQEMSKAGIPYGEWDESGDFDRMEDIIETIMHEGGHAAALGRANANLEDELGNWATDRAYQFLDEGKIKPENKFFVVGTIRNLLDYLANEYIAAIAEGHDNKEHAMKNAYDQTIGSHREELSQLSTFFKDIHGELDDDIYTDIMMMILGAPNGWELQNKIMPLLDKYMNNINKTIFNAFKEGISMREKEELTWIRGEEPETRTRGSMMNPNYMRAIEGKNPDWKEQLRGE
tara:strand:+ start:1 stop:1119 length:1119 start_codon:yes stop_codon:yes gene_type:complete